MVRNTQLVMKLGSLLDSLRLAGPKAVRPVLLGVSGIAQDAEQ
jgi:hypothetical protein